MFSTPSQYSQMTWRYKIFGMCFSTMLNNVFLQFVHVLYIDFFFAAIAVTVDIVVVADVDVVFLKAITFSFSVLVVCLCVYVRALFYMCIGWLAGWLFNRFFLLSCFNCIKIKYLLT